MKLKVLSLGLLLVAGNSFAAEQKSESKLKVKKPAKVDKSDQLITNRRYRASTGSLSNLSLNSTIIYRGGSMDEPLSANRPNIAGRGDRASVARLNVNLTGTYRLNALNRINAGIGTQSLAPFHNSIDTQDPTAQSEFDRNQGRIDVFDPFIAYRHMNKFFDVQTIVTTQVTQYTAGNMRDNGYQNDLRFTFDTLYDVGSTGLSVGARFRYTKFFFDKNDEELRGKQQDQVAALEPQVEYAINDTVNLRTVFRTYAYQNNRLDSEMKRAPSTQDVGVGISVSRNVFLFPNFQFSYDNPTIENTNVGFVANINMF